MKLTRFLFLPVVLNLVSQAVLLSVVLLALSGCKHNNTPVNASAPEFTLQCDLNAIYSPVVEPVLSPASLPIGETSNQTVLVMHGKNGSPLRSHMVSLKAALNAEGYNVIMPYMPWSELTWNGTLCDSISYLNELITAEHDNDNYVILLGHSLAGPVSLAYSALSNTEKADAVNVVAPGHFIHQSSVLANEHASSLALAKSMVNSGQENQLATFQTYNNGAPVNISTTARIYLSMHDTTQFPAILSTIPLNTTDTLWLAGQSDNLTSAAKTLGITSSIPTTDGFYTYKEVVGDHFTVLDNVPAELKDFF